MKGVKRALLVPVVGECSVVDIKEGDELGQLQSLVGGYIELVRSNYTGLLVYVNEEGKLQGLPRNRRMTNFLRHTLGSDYIVGPAVIMGAIDDEGDAKSVPDWVVGILATALDR
jgi:Domain of unknown function (DUF3846)